MWFVKLAGGSSDIIETELTPVHCFPNPVNDKLHLSVFLEKISISTLDGRIVYNNDAFNNNLLDVSFLAPGIYILEAGNKNYVKIAIVK